MEMQPVQDVAKVGRKLQQWGYYYYDNGYNYRWLYWGVPIIAVGCGIFVFAIVLYLYRRKRRQATVTVAQTQQQPSYGAPVAGYPDYSAQYQQDYTNYSSYPPAQPGHSGYPPAASGYPPAGYPQPGKANVEMGYPSTTVPAHKQ